MRLLLGRGPAPMRARWAASSRRALQPSRDGHMAGPLPDAADVSNCCWRLLERQTATAAAAAAAGWTRWLGAAGRRAGRAGSGSVGRAAARAEIAGAQAGSLPCRSGYVLACPRQAVNNSSRLRQNDHM